MSNNGTVIVNETEQTVVVNETETTVVVRSPGPAGASAGGTVNSVDVSGGTTGLTFSGGPVTLAGTITMAGTLDVDNGGTGATTAANARANLSAAVLGANNDITSLSGITGGIATADYVDFDTSATPANAVGRVAWDATDGSLQLGLVGGNAVSVLGQTIHAYVKSAESVTINKGQPVYLYQATGNRASVKLASNNGDATSATTFGLAAEDIAPNQAGFVICQGVIDGLNTGSFNEGDILYLGATAGTLTATKPKAPNHMVYIGVVERANNGNGQIYVKVQNGYELDEIHDVQINSPANGQLIIYDATTGLWKNANITAGTGISITNGAGSISISAPDVGTVTSVATGTGLTGGPITSTGTISLANTTVTAASYGSASAVPTFTVDAQGRLTAASNTNIAIANTAVSGLGTMSTQNANSVAITGGSVSGITDLAVADGGTGASDAPTARSNLGAAASATTISAGTGLSGGGDLSANRTISLANTAVSAGSYGSATQSGTFTVDAQGRLTAASNVTVTPAFSSITGKPTTLAGYGITDAINSSEKGAANGVATLGSDSKIPSSQVPAIAITDTFVVASQAAMLALSTAEKGDVAVRTDINKTFILTADPYSTLANWQELLTPTDAVSSVNGETGVVVLDAADVGAPPTTRTITAGTGLSGGGDLSANRTISLADTAVSAGSYGSASAVPTFTVDAQGRLTAASNTNIAIANTAVSGLGTMSTQNANSVAITGGAIDGTDIGGTTRAAGNFTTLNANGNVTLGDATSDTVTVTGTVQPGVVISGSSSGDALRITQTGAGNALLVEDSTNPDATPFVVNADGNLVVGHTANLAFRSGFFGAANLIGTVYAPGSLFNLARFNSGVGGSGLEFNHSRNSTIGTNSALLSGDSFGQILFNGADGTGYITGAQIDAFVDGTPGTNDMPGRLVFSTTADGASSPTERLRIASDGKVSVTNGYATITSNSTSAALTVTQTGTGNALVVEDSANPDSTPVVIDASGRAIVGTTANVGLGMGYLLQVADATSLAGLAASNWQANATGSIVVLAKSRGGTVGTRTIVNSGDEVGAISFRSDDGTSGNFLAAAAITASIDGTPGTNDMPGRLVFSTTADGAASVTERMRIDSAGNALIGTTTNSNSSRLTVNGTISETVSSTQYLVASQYDIGTDPNEIPLNQYLGTMAYQDEAAINVGQAALSGNLTLNGGTANGVLYLDGSKITSSGSALVFDGSKLGIGASPVTPLYVKGTSGGTDPTVLTGERVRIQSNDITSRSTYLSLIAGTAANSGVFFGDQDSADVGKILYLHSDNSMQFYTNGSERMRLLSGGGLHLGTVSNATGIVTQFLSKSSANYAASAVFESDGSAANWARTDWKNANVATSGIIYVDQSGLFAIRNDGNLPMAFYTNGANERLRITAAGDVGIGTSSPGERLTVGGNVYANTGNFIANRGNAQANTAGSGLVLQIDGTTYAAIRQPVSETIAFYRGNGGTTESMRITSNGVVNIGRTTNLYGETLSVSGYAVIGSGTAGLGQAIIGSDASTGITGTVDNTAYVFRTNNTERMRISSAGRVSIGQTADTLAGSIFNVILGANGSGVLGLNNSANTNQSWGILINDSGLGSAGRLSIVQNVNGSTSGIGGGPCVPIISADPPTTANTTPRILVTAAAEVLVGGTTDNGAYNLQCNGTGVWGAGAYVNGSDARLKDNIQSLDSGLDIVAAMRPVTFQYKPEYSKDQSIQPGFIAQELQEAMAGKAYLKGVVQEGPNHLNVAYQNIIPILVKAIQELKSELDALKAQHGN